MPQAGYSKRSISEKLGLKPETIGFVVNAPAHYPSLLDAIPTGLKLGEQTIKNAEFIHLFVTDKASLIKQLPKLSKQMKSNGMLWISWPKGASGIKTDVNERVVREAGLANGLVDVKVCAIDDRWSGLKFVIRLKDRKGI